MHRVYVSWETAAVGAEVTLSNAQSHYLGRVLRLRPGERVCAFNGAGHEWDVELTEIAPKGIQGRILATATVTSSTAHHVILGQGLPKHAKMDLIVEKCSELGLTTLVPIYATRSVIREVPERLQARQARWSRIAEAAARQCGRTTVLEIPPPQSFAEFCAAYASAPTKLLCWEAEQRQGVR